MRALRGERGGVEEELRAAEKERVLGRSSEARERAVAARDLALHDGRGRGELERPVVHDAERRLHDRGEPPATAVSPGASAHGHGTGGEELDFDLHANLLLTRR
jgi:hypothetical protein